MTRYDFSYYLRQMVAWSCGVFHKHGVDFVAHEDGWDVETRDGWKTCETADQLVRVANQIMAEVQP